MMSFVTKIKFAGGRRKIYLFGFCLLSYKRKKSFLPSTTVSFPPSEFANMYLDGLRGIEIGGSAHNKFYLNTLNVNYTDQATCFSEKEKATVGEALKVDIVAKGDDLPFKDCTVDFVLSSHVLEHFWDPIRALKEWLRVVRPGGYLFMIIPHKERTFDIDRVRTPLQELIDRHSGIGVDPGTHAHFNVWITEDVLELCHYLELNVVAYQDQDDKVGNGFAVVIQKAFIPRSPSE
jgi:SAM-dependent methyltransferase